MMHKANVYDYENDVIGGTLDLVRRALKKKDQLTESDFIDIEYAARQIYGGATLHIGRRPSPMVIKNLVMADSAKGIGNRAIARTYGVSVRTVERYLATKS